ncbi:hydroxymethylglutaryl-CoA lyase [Flavitalea sp. BT771]|uniref:hydroxymethylglutaryl-CoA lyase n=1 Tax=Flavitalea sp. BT771 TaxID=3063329 RepID=UPI0026E308DF|nr:hydroxymethylglutaryl-CoA lyase [Flavitalea sp. BT771]MDO6430110.1 hydroxymethylglutaryl-CoA lyase [Flavitalea sp. BT771]MDV6219751.1 hydroxymethylglutaryl-CoA lyase [Flavitalea sp. BT771]
MTRHNGKVTLVECPRDAMQGWPHIIPTEKKIEYINSLLKAGFDTLDFGSFVSARAIPQMADTAQVLAGLQLHGNSTKLLAIVANFRGAEEAAAFDEITCLGFPFSVSETFQLRNANKTVEGSIATVEEIQDLCVKRQKELVVYISMGFGNPYGDPWSEEIVFQWVDTLTRLGIRIISLADTVGLATPEQVFSVTDYLVRQLPDHTIGVHLHSTATHWKAKIDAALQAGCRRFDGALKGIGGCPMAGDHLVGNMDSALMIPYFEHKGLTTGIDHTALTASLQLASEIFV